MARMSRARLGTRRDKTAVWYDRTRVGTLVKATNGGISFAYDADWLAGDAAFQWQARYL
ncbi:MAG: HipA protein [uncultured bacterium]|nr:MAG: HipA protein [uncultured bacterium]